MSAHCCNHEIKVDQKDNRFRNALYIALILNFSMFLLEIIQGISSASLSLKADAIDFLGDSLNYFISLFVIGSALHRRAKVSLFKATSMLIIGLWVLFEALITFNNKTVPDSFTMSWVGVLALIINVFVAIILYRFRNGDSNMQSVWLCSRNDAIGNIAVVLASGGVYYLNSKWPDLIVASIMAILSVSASLTVFKAAKKELATI